MQYEILEYSGIGYRELLRFKSWRVAVLNYIEELEVDSIPYVEAHVKTDEVFVLLKGSATLFFADVIENQVIGFNKVTLEPNKAYNIKAGIYHTHTLSNDCQLLIIEEADTDDSNSKKIVIDDSSRKLLKDIL